MPTTLHNEFQRLLRWYPRDWRERNEQAMLGALLDQAQARGLQHPTRTDRASIRIAGLKERLLGPIATSRFGLVANIIFMLFALVYVSQTWAPGPSYDGFVGPFANPSVITAVVIVAAMAMTVARKARLARLLIVIACLAELVMGILAGFQQWLGPSFPTVAVFLALGLFAIARPRGVGRIVLLAGAIVALWVGCEALEVALLSGVPLAFDRYVGADLMVAIASFLCAVLLAWPWPSRRRLARSDDSDQPDAPAEAATR